MNPQGLEDIVPHIAQHQIELDNIPQAHQFRYKVNPNYLTMVKHDLNKLFDANFDSSNRRSQLAFPI